MTRRSARRVVALAFLTLLALGTVACDATVGVGVGVGVYGGWGPYGGYARPPYGGTYVGRPVWP